MFRRPNFSAAIVLTFLTGFAMFGAVTFLPQFQQNVQGASATDSGLLLLPLMAGMLTTSLVGGQYISRTGRYRCRTPRPSAWARRRVPRSPAPATRHRRRRPPGVHVRHIRTAPSGL